MSPFARITTRLPAISSRSSRSPRKAKLGGTLTSMAISLSGCMRLMTAQDRSATGATSVRLPTHVEGASGAGSREIVIDLAAHRRDLSRYGIGERPVEAPLRWPAPSRRLQECARFATLGARAPHHFRAVRNQAVQFSRERGNLGRKSPSNRRARPSRMRPSASLTRLSGMSPTRLNEHRPNQAQTETPSTKTKSD